MLNITRVTLLSRTEYHACARQCDGKPETLAEPQDRAETFQTAEQVLEGDASVPTEGALYFHADGVTPAWAASLDRTGAFGGHVFCR